MRTNLPLDKLIPIGEAAAELPNRPNAVLLWRWWSKGVAIPGGRVKLETLRIGRRRYTTREAMQRFIAAQNADVSPAPSPDAQRQQAAATDARLRAAGVL